MPFSANVDTARRLELLSVQIKKAEPGLQRRMRRNIRAAAQPAVADLRAAVLGVDVTSEQGGTARPDRSTNLRGRVAAALTVQTTTNVVAIRVNSRKVDPVYGNSLTRGLAGQGRWRHPVFGNRDVWTQQYGQPWFYPVMERHQVAFRAAVEKAMDETARELAR